MGRIARRGWLQHMIYCASLLAKVTHLGFVENLVSHVFRSALGQGRGQVGLLALPLMISLQKASVLHVIGVRVMFVIFGVAFFAPFHAWAQQLVPSAHRYLVISLGYALGSQLLGCRGGR